jgi:hypothetical protein
MPHRAWSAARGDEDTSDETNVASGRRASDTGRLAATYTITSPNYNSLSNYSTCTTGTCANYTTQTNVTGSFTTTSPLAPNLSSVDVTSQVTSYSFSDGLNIYTNTDPNARVASFRVVTDGAGAITAAGIIIDIWKTGTSPHSAGNRLNWIWVSSLFTIAHNNAVCLAVGTSSNSGVADECVSPGSDAATSEADGDGATISGPPAPTPTAVPALSELGLVVLGALLSVVAWLSVRRLTA